MVETYYDPTVDGLGIEGFLNYANSATDGWFINLFLIMIWIVSSYVMSKSEWKMSNVITFSSLLVFLLSIIASLFLVVNNMILFGSSIVFVVALVWSVITRG